ncbi:MAG: iron ABC transporter permease, partial [Pseudomonadales bacterium]|nr:iron ABC transporter permease [Pseudomonadales bacterium]
LARRAFASQSASLFEAAQLSGLSAQQQFFRLSLPMARPAIIAGMALALMETLADYGTVEYFGIDVFSTGIFRTWFGLGDATAASQLASILLIAVIALLCLEKMHRRKAAFVQGQTKLVQRINLKPLSQALAISFCVSVISLGFLLPFLQLSYWTFWQNTAPFNQAFWQLSFNSLLLAALTAMAAIVLAVAFSYLQRFMRDNPISNAMVFLAGLGYALPGTIIAIGVMIPFTMLDKGLNAISESLFSVSPGLIFSGSLFILVFAYLIRFLPIALGSLQTAMQTIDPALDDAAQNLGETKPRIIAKVHLPLIKSSLFAAALLVFVDTLKELPATLALRPFNFNTLAVRSFELANDERLAAAAPAVIMIVLAGLLPVILLNASIHQSEKNNA